MKTFLGKTLHLLNRGIGATLLTLFLLSQAFAFPQNGRTEIETQHPALFLVGDSIMHTGTGDGETGPWGWGSEVIPMFDPARIHVYNEGLGGRSSRGYIQEGAWAKIMNRLQPGDWVIVQFGHNDAANSQNYPDRTTAKGNGDETEQIDSPLTHEKETIHSYGWYLRQYVKDATSKGAMVIICSPPPRNIWVDGKIVRGLDGYLGGAAEAARQSRALFIDLNTISADKYDALGQEATRALFNDNQHSRKAGAHLNAESVITGIKRLKDCPLALDLTSTMLSAPATQPRAHTSTLARPDPKEIPLPQIKTLMAPMPGVDQLPNRLEMPDVMTLVSGYIRRINVDIGDRIETGQVIAALEIPELSAQVAGAQAEVRHSRSEIARAESGVALAEASYTALHAAYTRLSEAARVRPGLVAEQELADSRAKDLDATAKVNLAKSTLEAAQEWLDAHVLLFTSIDVIGYGRSRSRR